MSHNDGDENDEGDEKSPLVDFLTKKGTLEIVCAIGDSGASPTEIDEQVNVSHETVTNRLSDGQYIYNVWDAEIAPPDSDYRKIFRLDTIGLNIKKKIDEVGMLEAFHQILPYRQELRSAEQKVKEWVIQNESEVQSEYVTGSISQSQEDVYEQAVDSDVPEDSTSDGSADESE